MTFINHRAIAVSSLCVIVCLAVAGAAAPASFAGEMSLAWDPVSDTDLAGYKIYYGVSSGNYTEFRDVGMNTSTTLTGLDPCTVYYVAVKAYDSEGLESDAFSNEVVGLPRPVVSAASPNSAEQGASLDVSVTGESFDSGASVEFSGTGITVEQVTYVSCNELTVRISIASAAPTGARDITVVNPDGSYGTGAGLFTVEANAPPTVSSTTPQAGASGVAVNVRPTVTFSEAMDPATITANNVRLLDASDQPVAQASGSPSLSANGLVATITPADPLAYDSSYRIWVRGGSTGVTDASGVAMAADWRQEPAFTTGTSPDTEGPEVTGTDPADGATDVSVDVQPEVTFDEALDPASVTAQTVQLLDAAGQPVAQAGGSPSLSADGMVVTIVPAASLDERSTYKIRVRGGSTGVKDEAGNARSSDWTQPTGFETENLPPGAVTNLRRTDVR